MIVLETRPIKTSIHRRLHYKHARVDAHYGDFQGKLFKALLDLNLGRHLPRLI